MKKTNEYQKNYQEIAKKLKEEFSYENINAVAKIKKVVINMGIGELSKDKNAREEVAKNIAAITGQSPNERKARISVAGFNVREGMPVGLAVTLRGEKMYSFLQKLFAIVLPRLRDFRGVSLKSFDKNGNYTLGFDDYSVFPEVDTSKLNRAFGLEITIVTTTDNPEEAKRLLELMGMPFEKKEENENG